VFVGCSKRKETVEAGTAVIYFMLNSRNKSELMTIFVLTC
jgi:hypothetical protein